MKNYITKQLSDSIEVKKQILENSELLAQIEQVAVKTIEAYKNNKKTLIAGNAGEFVSRFYFDRPGLASIALTTDTSILTAIGNDYGYERVFARQVEANGANGDVFIGISTSGNSKNIVEAIKSAEERGIFTVGFTGAKGGIMKEMCDICICVPSNETPRIQESHIVIGHIICAIVEKEMFEGK